jgi:predicted outer membrane protein
MFSGSELGGRRRTLRAFLLVALLVFSQLAAPAFAAAQNSSINDADRELLGRVRQAGLWEMPAGAWAMQRAESEQVRQVGMTLMVDHGRLEAATRDLAGKLGVTLPDKRTADQDTWLNEMQNARNGAEFQQIFANRLRAAHGVIFSFIANVRAGTRNDEMRAYAATANQVVMRHITLLESTGMVNYGGLPEAKATSATTASASQALDLQATDIITVALVGLLLFGATWLALWWIRNPNKKKSRHGGRNAAAPNPQPES